MDDPLPSRKIIDGTCLLINKPQGWTSFDVVNKIRTSIRHNLGVKKIKVGHAGTLDPMATGLLIVCSGKRTKKLSEYQDLSKEYSGVITFGATTPSYDAETEPDGAFPYEHITLEKLEAAKKQFLGSIQQVPPLYSAIKVDGQPLYMKARKGLPVEIQPRPVTIYEIEFMRIALPQVEFRVRCSKGTYIRSLAYDLGKALLSGAYLSSLCRTKIGDYSLDKAWELEKLIKHIEDMADTVLEC